MTHDKNEIKKWIENGGKCKFSVGDRICEIDKECALVFLPIYEFRRGLHELVWAENGETLIFFNSIFYCNRKEN